MILSCRFSTIIMILVSIRFLQQATVMALESLARWMPNNLQAIIFTRTLNPKP